MAIEIRKTILAVVDWSARRGRTYAHSDEESWCTECPGERPPFTSTCEATGHGVKRTFKTDMEEAAPAEAKEVQKLYGEVCRVFAKLGYACGRQVYLIAEEDADKLDAAMAVLRALFDEKNATFRVCSADWHARIVKINPSTSHEETLRSIRRDVDDAVAKLLGALDSGDVKVMRQTVKDTKNLAALLDGQSRMQVEALSTFTVKVARQLREAADGGEGAVDTAIHEAKQGAVRFAGIFAGLLAERDDPPTGGGLAPDAGPVRAMAFA